MTALWIAAGAAVALFVFFEIVRPLVAIRHAIERLAAGDYRPLILKTRTGLFRRSVRRMQALAEMLQQLDRQITDEGFSLRAILSSMVEGVLLVDRSQRVRLANDALGRMFQFGQSPLNRTLLEVFRSHELGEAIEEVLASGGGRRLELSLDAPAADGYSQRHFEVYLGGLRPKAGGLPAGAVIVFHDITALRELEAVRREFVANVSHEFRTPLAIINGYIETLLDGALDDRPMAERSLRVMHKNGQRLSLLIEDLLTISRIEHRTEQLDIREMNLRESFHRALERMEAAIAERGARVTSTWEPGVEVIEADSRRIEQVYTNLIENALRYGPAGGTAIHVDARRDGVAVAIAFTDNGPGIPPDDQKHIFDRFYRVHKDRSRVAGGTGLGLSIVKHICQAHGGSVELSSPPGKGCTFTVRLPCAGAQAKAAGELRAA